MAGKIDFSLAAEVRGDFPILHDPRRPPGERNEATAPSAAPRHPIGVRCQGPLVYLDSAATALKPQAVVDAVVEVLTRKTANVHRAVHHLGDLATEAFESSRQVVADFIGAEQHEVVFVRNTTEALNLVAAGWPEPGARLVSLGDHHSNLLAWQGDVRRLAVTADGRIDLQALQRELSRGGISLVSVTHVSNVIGTTNDIAAIAGICHDHGAALMVDAAQSAPHEALDVVDLGCDFLAFSGHKLGAPSGVGVLYGRAEQLQRIAWHQRGGATVDQVHAERVVPKAMPWRLEAGTPAIESVVGLAAAIEYLNKIGMARVRRHQLALAQYTLEQVTLRLPGIRLLGPSDVARPGPVSLVQRAVSPHLLARALSDRHGICVRSGFHCAQPLHETLGWGASLRLSFYLYNDAAEIDLAIDALERLLAVQG